MQTITNGVIEGIVYAERVSLHLRGGVHARTYQNAKMVKVSVIAMQTASN